MNPPLDGVRVLDFSRVLSGPYAAMTLADLGADVVKVEHPDYPDDTRGFGPPFSHGVSTYFLAVNRGKRAVAIDMKSAEGRQLAKRLALEADVVLENFRPGVMKRLGLDAATLRAEKPSLVFCSISGFGQDSTQAGYDVVIQGMGGVPSLIGPPDGGPYKVANSIADLVSGKDAVQAILAALLRKERTGQGATIDLSMIDGQRALLVYHASNWLNAGQAPRRMGNGHASIHPYATFEVADGYLNIGVANDKQWVAFCALIGRPDLTRHELYATNPDRVANRESLDAILIDLLATRTRDEWLTALKTAGIAAGPICTVPEALQGATLVQHEHPEGGDPVRTVPQPYVMDDAPRASTRRAPRVGEHDAQVVADWLG